MDSILTSQQQLALKLIAKTDLAQHFYFGGGTVLSHYYLQHRYSEDLDFFSQEEFDPQATTVAIKSFQKELGFESFDYQNSFNRNLYFLRFKESYVLKLEFTYYPFQQIEDLRMKAKLKFDWHIDPLQLASRLFEVSTHLDDPIINEAFDKRTIISFFQTEAEKLKEEILEK